MIFNEERPRLNEYLQGISIHPNQVVIFSKKRNKGEIIFTTFNLNPNSRSVGYIDKIERLGRYRLLGDHLLRE